MKKIIVLFLTALVLSACTGPMYVTSVPTYNNTVNKVVAAIEDQGYSFVEKKHDTQNQSRLAAPPFEGNVNSSDWIPLEFVNLDTYCFADTDGNKMSFVLLYRIGVDHTNGVVYYTDVQTDRCFTTNDKDYVRLCGERSPLRMLDTIQKDMTIKP